MIVVGVIFTQHWLPVGPAEGFIRNFAFVVLLVGGLLLVFRLFQHFYPTILGWCLEHKIAFLSLPLLVVILGLMVWQGFAKVLFFVPEPLRQNPVWTSAAEAFPGLGREFMPALDEGSFLNFPRRCLTLRLGKSLDVIAKQDMAFQAIPEVDSVVGKLGRVDSPLDPAPISMIETIINYKGEYVTDADGHRLRFKYDRAKGEYVRDAQDNLIPDPDGRPYRQWRDHIRSPDDIWDEIVWASRFRARPARRSSSRLRRESSCSRAVCALRWGSKSRGPT